LTSLPELHYGLEIWWTGAQFPARPSITCCAPPGPAGPLTPGCARTTGPGGRTWNAPSPRSPPGGAPAQAPLPRRDPQPRLAQVPHRSAEPAQPGQQGTGQTRRRLGAGHLSRLTRAGQGPGHPALWLARSRQANPVRARPSRKRPRGLPRQPDQGENKQTRRKAQFSGLLACRGLDGAADHLGQAAGATVGVALEGGAVAPGQDGGEQFTHGIGIPSFIQRVADVV
jgi:hypothetical protein